MDLRFRMLLALALVVATASASTAGAAPRHFTSKKAIWGPVTYKGKPQFPIYHDLGAGIWEHTLTWADVAPTQPADPRSPTDPAYRWPADLDRAVTDAKRYHIRISLLVQGTPPWANGGRSLNWVPSPSDLADFVTAAARRYPTVKLWMIWGEPSRRGEILPPTPGEKRGTPPRQKRKKTHL